MEYYCGEIYNKNISVKKRQQILISAGIICLITLLVLRGFNIYGETLAWVNYGWDIKSLMSFLNFTKYPPSLDFLLITIGISSFILSWFEDLPAKSLNILKTFGSSPMFFYVVHLYILLMLYKIASWSFKTSEDTYWGVDYLWLIWLLTIILACILYFPTRQFSKFKQQSTSKLIKYF